MRFVLVLGVLAACGRLGFDPAGAASDSAVEDASSGDATDALMIPTCGADGLCAAMCAPLDPDCVTTCGDGLCLGNGGELCSTCMADCATLQPVCGNGACDPGEAAAACYADCGPTPWPWTAEESSLLTMINARRTSGFKCPGEPAVSTAPALVAEPMYLPAAREWAWEIAHQNIRIANGDVCNGRTWVERDAASDYDRFLHSFGGGITPAGAISAWLADPGSCLLMMSPALTRVGIATAHDAEEIYVLLLR